MQKIRLGIIGTGIIINEAHLPALLRLTDRFEVTALCNRTRSKAEAVAGRLGVDDGAIWQDWRTFLAEAPVDAVLIALPIEMNFPVGRAAAEAGKHVLCEKPVGQNSDEAKQAVGLAEKYGVTYMVAEDCHFVPQFARAAELVKSGSVGRVRAVNWNVFMYLPMSDKYAQTTWRTEHVFPGGYVLDGGVHFVHVLQMVAGRVEAVKAETMSVDPRLGKVDTAFALLRHESGVLSSLNMGWRTRSSQRPPLQIFGERAALSVGWEELVRIDNESGKTENLAFEDEDGYYLQLAEFHRALTTGSPPAVSTASCAHDVDVVLAILAAAERNETVRPGA